MGLKIYALFKDDLRSWT